jgi:hypothetical protein
MAQSKADTYLSKGSSGATPGAGMGMIRFREIGGIEK